MLKLAKFIDIKDEELNKMRDDRMKRLNNGENQENKKLEEIDHELMSYIEDLRRKKKLKKKNNENKKFSVGEIVTVKGNHGTIIYGPYKSHTKKEKYEIEMEDGDILTVEDDGQSIIKYTQIEDDFEDDKY